MVLNWFNKVFFLKKHYFLSQPFVEAFAIGDLNSRKKKGQNRSCALGLTWVYDIYKNKTLT